LNTKYTLLDVKNAYVAGILDGEGSVTIYSYTKNERSDYGGYIAITSTTLELIKWLHKELGGNYCKKKKEKPSRKQGYRWNLYGQAAAVVLWRLYPYLIVKKEHVRIYHKFYRSITKWKNEKHGLDEETVLERERLIKEMHELNRGGNIE